MEAPQLESNIWQVYGPEKVQVLGVDGGESPATVQSWAASNGLTYPILMDPTWSVYDLFGDGYIPYNVLLDRFNIVRFSDSGYDEQTLIELIEFYSAPFYSHMVSINKNFMNLNQDTLIVTSQLVNPGGHNISVMALINSMDNSVTDSFPMFDDGMHDDGAANDNIFGGFILPQSTENEFQVHIKSTDVDSANYNIFEDAARFTTVGPVAFSSYNITNLVSDYIFLKISLHNESSVATAENVTASLETTDTLITGITSNLQQFGNIAAGDISECSGTFFLRFTGEPDTVHFKVNIQGNGTPYWTDEFYLDILSLNISKSDDNIPGSYALKQNYPNPFNPVTNIEFRLAKSGPVTLKIYNHLGETVTTLVNEELAAGNYKYKWNASNLSSGLYYYKLTSGKYTTTKKMVLLK